MQSFFIIDTNSGLLWRSNRGNKAKALVLQIDDATAYNTMPGAKRARTQLLRRELDGYSGNSLKIVDRDQAIELQDKLELEGKLATSPVLFTDNCHKISHVLQPEEHTILNDREQLIVDKLKLLSLDKKH